MLLQLAPMLFDDVGQLLEIESLVVGQLDGAFVEGHADVVQFGVCDFFFYQASSRVVT